MAGFIGSSNMVRACCRATRSSRTGRGLPLAGRYAGAGPCTLALRPERVRIGAGGAGLQGTVELGSYLGAVREHLVRLGPELKLVVRDATAGAGRCMRLANGSPCSGTWPPSAYSMRPAGRCCRTTNRPTMGRG